MNKKQAKTMRKGYSEAGAVYWTKDMEKAIRKIHKAKYFWMTVALVEFPILAFFTIRFFF